MKKSLFKITALMMMLLLLTSCGKPEMQDGPGMENPDAENIEEPQKPEENKPEEEKEPVFTEEAFMEDIKPALDCLYTCNAEIFGADVDFDTSYYAGLKDGEPAVLYTEEEGLPEGYEQDPAYASYYPVSNFSTNAEVRAYIERYMDPGMSDRFFRDDFLELDGALYLCRGGRGYGTLLCDRESAEYAGEKGGLQTVRIDYTLFDEYDHSELLFFADTEKGWILSDAEEIE